MATLLLQAPRAHAHINPFQRRLHRLVYSNRTTLRQCLASSHTSSSAVKVHRCAIVGAGFAGMSVAWHLLQHCSERLVMSIDIVDEVGIAGGASGASGGLLHPYSSKGKLLWHGLECWNESLNLVSVAEAAVCESGQKAEICSHGLENDSEPILRRGILRIPIHAKNADDLKLSSQGSLARCKISCINGKEAEELVPGVTLNTDFAFYLPQAMTLHPERYLKALFLACQEKARELATSKDFPTQVSLQKTSIVSLLQLSGKYDSIVVCTGAKALMLPELQGKIPLSTCRGVVANLELPTDLSESYGAGAPSILSSGWLAARGPRKLVIGSTRVWNSSNLSCHVSSEEASIALNEIIPKICTVFPPIVSWSAISTKAGVRAMPPQTSLGTLPIIGCIDHLVNESMGRGGVETLKSNRSIRVPVPKYWFVGGLGSRGLIYHGYLGKLIAKAIVTGDPDSLPSELISWLL